MKRTLLTSKAMVLMVTVFLFAGFVSAIHAQQRGTEPTGLTGRGAWGTSFPGDDCFSIVFPHCTLTLGAVLLGDGSAMGGYRLVLEGLTGQIIDRGMIVDVSPPAVPFDYWCIVGESTAVPGGSWIFGIRDMADGGPEPDMADLRHMPDVVASCVAEKVTVQPRHSLTKGDFHAH
jgi:hypothetical protein